MENIDWDFMARPPRSSRSGHIKVRLRRKGYTRNIMKELIKQTREFLGDTPDLENDSLLLQNLLYDLIERIGNERINMRSLLAGEKRRGCKRWIEKAEKLKTKIIKLLRSEISNLPRYKNAVEDAPIYSAIMSSDDDTFMRWYSKIKY